MPDDSTKDLFELPVLRIRHSNGRGRVVVSETEVAVTSRMRFGYASSDVPTQTPDGPVVLPPTTETMTGTISAIIAELNHDEWCIYAGPVPWTASVFRQGRRIVAYKVKVWGAPWVEWIPVVSVRLFLRHLQQEGMLRVRLAPEENNA